ncbi:sulfatase-like hydrolase/transferase [Neolewinella agarilytica]|uniref:sulfatase-like hydrolase/transferase n=1 Tax=Neolewinella agarilytica TaxID=478744 RepID=UPI0023573562|nr:sulfatase-like hydrolase/transferase [Neolewinella agarilytica]
MRRFLPLLLLTLLCTCDRAEKSQGIREPDNQEFGESESREELPNVLFILTDDQGYGDLSMMGNDSIETPHMDALLQSGAFFDRFYVSPVCAPTRASFLSGLYAPRTGAVFVTRRRETMDDGILTLPEYLRHAGYRTGLFGKWHNGATFPYHPGGQGFEEFLGFTLGHFNDYFEGELVNERDEVVPFSGDLTEILTDTASHFMQQESSQPFFCMLTYQAPHTPVQVSNKHWDRVSQRGLTPYNTGIYAMIESIDEQIGRLLEELEQAGKLENTLIVFATDNGPNGDRYRAGLKGTKGQVDEGGVRVPFGIRFPGNHPANGRKISTPAAHIDLVPTLLELVDLPVPEELDGQSLLPLLLPEHPDTFNQERFIYAFKQGYDFTPYPGSMRDQNFLYVLRGPNEHELYQLDKDPGQRTDIMQTKQDWLKGLRSRGRDMAEAYATFAATVARPDLVAPPIDLDAAPGPIRLLAHEGEPRGKTHFMDKYGWANDFFVDLGSEGAYWPVETDEARSYRVKVRYHLEGNRARTLVLRTDKGNEVSVALPPARTTLIPVADRVKRKEVYPRRWAEVEVAGLSVSPGSRELSIASPGGEGLWVKEITLE